MKAICYISNFAKDLNINTIDQLVTYVTKTNQIKNITGILILKNNHFFQILEGNSENVDLLYEKIKKDNRHTGLITLLDIHIKDRIFDDYNSGNFNVFQKFADMKKLYLYFNWITKANYLPADELVQLTTNFLKHNT